MKELKLGGRTIGSGQPPFIIAEMSGNHNESLDRALEIVDAAADAGAHALKIQTYTADTMTLNLKRDEFFISDEGNLWKGTSLYDLYQKAHTPWKWHAPIFERCKKRGLIGFSTPFDATSVDFLESLNVPFYKISSFEVTDIPLIRKVAKTHKPIIMSTGMATVEEIDEAVAAMRAAGCKDIVLLKCTSTYPASPDDTNILTIPALRERFQCEVGLSDHTMGIGVATATIALGATVIEKHFTLARADGGVDSAFSLEPAELKALVVETERAWHSLGEVRFGPTEKEKASLRFRRSLYIGADLKEGDVLTEKNLRIIRPGLGLPPKHYDELLGKRVLRDVRIGTPMTWDLVSKNK